MEQLYVMAPLKAGTIGPSLPALARDRVCQACDERAQMLSTMDETCFLKRAPCLLILQADHPESLASFIADQISGKGMKGSSFSSPQVLGYWSLLILSLCEYMVFGSSYNKTL